MDEEADAADPRIHADHVRTVDGRQGTVTLVGVVHDHPASRYRVDHFVRTTDPDVVALETPPLALPLFEQYATDGPLPPLGGELSAAIAAAEDAHVVGIDGLDTEFFRTLTGRLRGERSDSETIRSVLGSVAAVLGHAVRCRVAAELARLTGIQIGVADPVDHECSLADAPSVQADHERTQLSTSLTFLRVSDPPPAVRIRDETREACMARRLATLSEDGAVLAVVGRSHVEPLADRLTEAG